MTELIRKLILTSSTEEKSAVVREIVEYLPKLSDISSENNPKISGIPKSIDSLSDTIRSILIELDPSAVRTAGAAAGAATTPSDGTRAPSRL